MDRIRNAFEDRKAFIAYLTAGDPDLSTTRQLILAMEQTGVDMVKIGMPYENISVESDDIKSSNKRAIDAGIKTEDVFEMIKSIRKSVRIPMIILAYLETIKEYGISRFMRKCKEVDIDGLVVPNLVFEERKEISRDCDLFGVRLISVVNPSPRDRIASIAKGAKGFVYCEADKLRNEKDNQIDHREIVATIRANANVPCAMGFGVNTPDQAKTMARISDGVVIGSGIVKAIALYGKDCIRPVTEYVRTMKAALRQA